MKYISNKDDIWQEETVPGMLLEERKLFKIKKKFKNKEIHNGCAKMQNNIVAGCIKGWSANLKLKKLSLLKLPLP